MTGEWITRLLFEMQLQNVANFSFLFCCMCLMALICYYIWHKQLSTNNDNKLLFEVEIVLLILHSSEENFKNEVI